MGSFLPDFYYKVERSENPDFFNSIDLPGQIFVKKGIYLYHYVDNLIPKGDTKFYYRVNLWKSGVKLNFSTYDENGSLEKLINNKNEVLEVYIPPPNMAFVHRYMINKQQCKKIDLNINHGIQNLIEMQLLSYMGTPLYSST